MSHHDAPEALCRGDDCRPVDLVIEPRSRQIGAFEVRRVLPVAQRRSVGPFVFFDQMGPTVFQNGQFLDVGPHPHIGLSTITWLTEGEIVHRDSLGSVQTIRPGEVNWMTAGSGVVHSERSPDSERRNGARVAGIQAWIALPETEQDCEPSFQHYPSTEIPWLIGDGVRAALIVGRAWGMESPVVTPTDTLYADIALEPGATLDLPEETPERAVYGLAGDFRLNGAQFGPSLMTVLTSGTAVTIHAGPEGARLMLCGGEPLDGPRHMYWNFVSTSKERIEAAKSDWTEGRFAAIPGEGPVIPLPGR
ncbi:pirin family protein [Pacificispira sp.]|uniref:pirin family protein n=1 Tax=Pacificispira sp. TaxID=2888761 RepID=UPI003BAB343D